jgi:hypothetical protein
MNKILSEHGSAHYARGSMPIGQTNANLSEGMVMRVGIPQSGGRLSFHAFEEGFPVMVSASAFWNPSKGCFRIPEASNLFELDLALDSAGFTAMKLWKEKGSTTGIGNVFPWSFSQYIELACSVGANWWSQPDLCCEPEIASSQEEIDYRINATATLLEGALRVVYHWQNELAKTCSPSVVSNMIRPPVPIIQGWSVSDYQRSLDLLMQVWSRWQPWLATPALIGIGSVCRRNLKHPTHGLHAILAGLEGKLPAGSRLHLFGVKGSCLSELKMLDWVASADSMAYDFGARLKAHQGGFSNTVQLRSAAMSQWMQTAADKLLPAAGDQFRLPLFN